MPPKRRQKRKPYTRGRNTWRQWHFDEPLLSVLSLKDLHKNGYIDWPVAGEAFPPLVHNFELANPLREAYEAPLEHTPTLPAFRKRNWIGLRDGDYEAILPAIRLASCILCEPSVLMFFNGLSQDDLEEFEKDNHVLKERLKVEHLYRFKSIANDAPHFTRTTETIKRMIEMKDLVTFEFKDYVLEGYKTQGATQRGKSDGFFQGWTTDSQIWIRTLFISILRGGRYLSKFPKAEDFDERAAKARTQFLLAITLVHEFSHAFVNSALDRPFETKRDGVNDHTREPSYGNDRVSEVGCALEQAIFSGIVRSLAITHYIAPYGFGMFVFPGGHIAGGHAEDLYSAASRGFTHEITGLVAVKDYQRYFTAEFWNHRVVRDGANALKLPWDVAVRAWRELPDNDLFDGEIVAAEPDWQPDVPSFDDLEKMGFTVKATDQKAAEDDENTSSSEIDVDDDETYGEKRKKKRKVAEGGDSMDVDDESDSGDFEEDPNMEIGEGYDDDGYDKDGRDRQGFDRRQVKLSRLNTADRYMSSDEEYADYNKDGYDAEGVHKDGYTRSEKQYGLDGTESDEDMDHGDTEDDEDMGQDGA